MLFKLLDLYYYNNYRNIWVYIWVLIIYRILLNYNMQLLMLQYINILYNQYIILYKNYNSKPIIYLASIYLRGTGTSCS